MLKESPLENKLDQLRPLVHFHGSYIVDDAMPGSLVRVYEGSLLKEASEFLGLNFSPVADNVGDNTFVITKVV